MANKAQFDLNTLSAVKPGLDSTLAEIIAEMEKYLGAPESNVVALEKARTELQSLLGVLKMVGLDGLAVFCTELATMLSDLAANPQQVSVMHRDVLRRALFGVTHFLDALAGGADNAALRLFPEYQEMQQLRGLELSFEMDLFYPSLAVQLPPQILNTPPPVDAAAKLKVLRSQYQQGLLRWMRQEDDADAVQQMQQAVQAALRCLPQNDGRGLWWIAYALFECLKLGALTPEMNVRKLLGRIDQQMRTVAEGKDSDDRSMLNEMLFLIGQCDVENDHVNAIKQVYSLDNYLPAQSSMPPGEIDKQLEIMRDQLRVAEESWELCVQGDNASCEKFVKYVELLTSQSEKLDRDVLQYLVKQIQGLSQYANQPEYLQAISMDMAMALLLLGSGIENYSRLGSGFQEQARILIERMQAAVKEQPEDEGRLTELVGLHAEMDQRTDVMGPLANEMLVNLQHVEQGLNTFFNDASNRGGLTELLRLLNQIQGGFRISSLVHAEKLMSAVQDRLRRFTKSNDIPKAAERYALADALSAMENYMQHLIHGQAGDVWRLKEALTEMVKLDQPVVTTPEVTVKAVTAQSKQPQGGAQLKTIQVEPPKIPSTPEPVRAEMPTLSLEPELPSAEKPLVSVPLLNTSVEKIAPPISFDLELPAAEKPQAIAPIEVIQIEPDEPEAEPLSEEEQELLDIFLEEAKEVLNTIGSHLEICKSQPANHEALVTVRRGFHTLKGSGRMVGLNDLGEVAWSVERALNKWLQDGKPATANVLNMIDTAQQAFVGWVEMLGKQGVAQIEAPDIIAAAARIESGADVEIPEVSSAATAEAAPVPEHIIGLSIEEAPGTEPKAVPVSESGLAFETTPESEVASVPESEIELAFEESSDATTVTTPEVELPFETITTPGQVIDLSFEAPPESETEVVAESEAVASTESAFEFESISPEGVVVSAKSITPELFEIASTESKQNVMILFQQLEAMCTSTPPTVQYDFMRAAHTLAGVNRTMGFNAVAELASALEGWLEVRLEHPFTLNDNQLHMLGQAVATLNEMALSIGEHQIPEMRSDLVEHLLADKDNFGEATARVSVAEVSSQSTEPDFQIQQFEAEPLQSDNSIDEQFVEADVIQGSDKLISIQEITIPDVSNIQQIESHDESEKEAQVSEDLSQLMAELGEIGKVEDEPAKGPEAERMAGEPPLAIVVPVPEETRAGKTNETLSSDKIKTTALQVEAVSESVAVLQPVARTVAKPVDEDAELDKPQVYDELDDQLLPVFLEEADELGPKIGEELRIWRESPQDEQQENLLKRLLHTMKGSSRMVGAMRIGEIAHQMEDLVAAPGKRDESGYWDKLESDFDRINALIEELRGGKPVVEVKQMPIQTPNRRATDQPVGVERRAERRGEVPSGNMLRVRSDVVDRLVNEAGEISVSRSRIETEMRLIKNGLLELTASVTRLRQQLREVEIQAESQMQARVSLAKESSEQFDPLEFDRFTRLQELTRFMNESVHDVQTIQQSMLKHLDETDAAILAQARLNRELQQGLMNVRMVSFNSITDRLYRIVRQTGKELNKRANLELQGTNVELDRSVLEKMVAPFEHLLRNSIVHGLENEQQRAQSGKLPIGEIRLSVRQESNEVVFEFSDDGAGLNYEKLREKAVTNGTFREDEKISEEQLAQMIFMPGLSTASEITEIAGRGVGMDVVRSEIAALGGSINVGSKRGQGTRFTIHLPLTLAVTQILMVGAGGATYAIPAAMVEQVRQEKSADMETLNRERQLVWHGNNYPLYYLPHMLGSMDMVEQNLPRNPVLLLRSGEQRIALHVDELLGNQEVMVKNIGPQLARLSGIAGATVLGDGSVIMILNPVQLAQRIVITGSKPVKEPSPAETAVSVTDVSVKPVVKAANVKPLPTQPSIMVVDDSLTVRKITSRMLLRAGYQVVTATDGVDALEKLEEYTPDVMLLDIEMPRMDGFALARELRRASKTKDMPIIMITSRTADKHREYAMQLGVNTYLGKPYQEDDLLQNIADFVAIHKLDA